MENSGRPADAVLPAGTRIVFGMMGGGVVIVAKSPFGLLFGELLLLLPVCLLAGGIIGWLSRQQSRLAVIGLGISLPALIAIWAGADPRRTADTIGFASPSLAAFIRDVDARAYAVRLGCFEEPGPADDLAGRIDLPTHNFRALVVTTFKNCPYAVEAVPPLSFRDALAVAAAAQHSSQRPQIVRLRSE